jgi:hypothetical protein
VTAEFIEALRWLLLTTSLALMARAVSGFLAFGLGRQGIGTYFRSLVFLMGLRSATVQFGFLVEGISSATNVPLPRLALTLFLELVVLCHAHWGLWWLGRKAMRGMKAIFDHVGEAMAIAELAEVNPEAAEALAVNAMRLVVDDTIRRAERGRGHGRG